MEYRKLIRDYIPAIITAAGRSCETRVLDQQEFLVALREKLVEEAQEVRTAREDQLPTELADVLEVFETLLAAHGVSMEEVRLLQAERRRDRGGFASRLQLIRVQE
ncbi:nucleoside triphosphate pyrophosphohydrolase [Hymenobacter volaticus]|uniref:Nucleoside triphosphate pyrophosphohydrolase n=1 Tax=Hymenobacter volaticus TaxID=2932254 RepID=A0ABY4GFS7_9BACT|nr:nucleoside triphosphate pyrophosphohydrolase [Hymenobacter volaticus]UOQ69174.1 nucleoside triphosphate pyrophosphohydrolase [Hymenobacter volaticus]